MAGIYIHIPFCRQACSYCDFYFVTQKRLIPDFVDSLVNEIRLYNATPYSAETIQTIYLGGGTPSLLQHDQIERIFSALHEIFRIEPVEITMELNPDDVTEDYLYMIKHTGITRVSMGIQSFHPELLGFMHRAHTKGEAIRAMEAIQKTNFPDFSADLIYGNPSQTIRMLQEDVEQFLDFNPPHLSAYSLTIEPGTRLGKQVELGRLKPAGDAKVAEHIDILQNMLAKSGLQRYEVSNFSLPGREAVHNRNYWDHHNYLGLGPAAHSFWWQEGVAERWANKADIRNYLNNEPENYQKDSELLDLVTLAEERLMLGLRTAAGVDTAHLLGRYGYGFSTEQQIWIRQQVSRGTLIFENGTLQLTDEGLKICDMLVVDLLARR